MRSLSSDTADSDAGSLPSPDDVRAQLARILYSPDLPASERRRAFLRFVVEETLSGRAESLKGYTIAVSVFGRDETFDAQTDPVVRLEARRLRRDLDSYYVGAGSRDPVRISIPKGSYVPRFERQEREWLERALHPEAPGEAPAASPDEPRADDAPGALALLVSVARAHPKTLLATALVSTLVALAAVAYILIGGH